MRHTRWSLSGRITWSQTLAIFAASLMVMLIIAGCDKQQTQQQVSGDNKNAATPQPSRTPDEGDKSDTPIVISGGSTEIDFDHKMFQPVAANPNKFSTATPGAVESIIVFDESEDAEEDDWIRFVLPNDGLCTLKLGYPGNKFITISNEATGKVDVEFDTGDFKVRPQTPSTKVRRHRNKKIKLQSIEVKDGGSAVTCRDFQQTVPCTLPAGKKFAIEIRFKPNP